MHGLIPALALSLLMAFAAGPAVAAPKDRGLPWASLTADQQKVLAPLAPEWDKFSKPHKTKWLGIAKRYPAMKPEEQSRVQSRMQSWAKLTPEQRDQARERYRSIGKIAPPDRRAELRRHWAEYQALSPQEKHMYDVPASYIPPAERRAHVTAPAKHKPRKPSSPSVAPAPL